MSVDALLCMQVLAIHSSLLRGNHKIIPLYSGLAQRLYRSLPKESFTSHSLGSIYPLFEPESHNRDIDQLRWIREAG